jgi:hypothetical protein
MTTTMPTGDWSTTEPATHTYPSCAGTGDCAQGDRPCTTPTLCRTTINWWPLLGVLCLGLSAVLVVALLVAIA